MFFKFIADKIVNDFNFKELITGSVSSLIIRIFAIFSSYLFSFLIAKLYGANILGTFVLAQTMLLMFSIIARLGLDTAAVKFISKAVKQKQNQKLKFIYSQIFKAVIISSIFLNVILFLIAPLISIYISKPEMNFLYKIISFGILPFSLLLINSECFRGMKQILYYSLFRNMSTPFIASIILIIFYLLNLKTYEYPLYSYLLSITFLSMVSYVLWNQNLSDINFKTFPEIKIWSLLSESLPMMLTSSMSYLLNWTSILILAFYRPEWEIGVYNIAWKISLLTSISLFAINSIAAPKFAELFTENTMNEFQSTISDSTRLIFWTSSPILLLILFFPTFFLGLFGNEFIYGKWTLIFLTMGQFANSISGSVGYILQMTGQQKNFQYIIFVSTIINIIMNLILVPKYGINGSALSSFISICFWNFSSVVLIKKKYNILTLYYPKFFK